tara:strand:+ start:422 stop:1162 length:741 start_codon:yes stop_codon:yes gene_type:complete
MENENIQALKEILVSLCSEQDINISTLFLHGSHASGTASLDSDIDAIVLDDKCVKSRKVQVRYENHLIQLIVMSSSEALDALHFSRARSAPFFAVSFDTSIVLIDNDGLGEYIKTISKQILKLGPLPAHPQEIELKRISFLNFLNDGTRKKYTGSTIPESILWASQVINMCFDLLVIYADEWRFNNSRFKGEILRKTFFSIRSELLECLLLVSENNSREEFSEKIREIMHPFVNLNENSVHPHCST